MRGCQVTLPPFALLPFAPLVPPNLHGNLHQHLLVGRIPPCARLYSSILPFPLSRPRSKKYAVLAALKRSHNDMSSYQEKVAPILASLLTKYHPPALPTQARSPTTATRRGEGCITERRILLPFSWRHGPAVAVAHSSTAVAPSAPSPVGGNLPSFGHIWQHFLRNDRLAHCLSWIAEGRL